LQTKIKLGGVLKLSPIVNVTFVSRLILDSPIVTV